LALFTEVLDPPSCDSASSSAFSWTDGSLDSYTAASASHSLVLGCLLIAAFVMVRRGRFNLLQVRWTASDRELSQCAKVIS